MTRKQMSMFLIFFIIGAAEISSPASPEHHIINSGIENDMDHVQSWYERLTTTPPGEDWLRMRRHLTEWTHHARQCRRQLRKRTPPLACYQLIQRELEWRFLSADEHRLAEQSLHRICAQDAEAAEDPERLRLWVKSVELPKECRSVLIARLEKVLYRWQRDLPERAFHERGRF